MLQGLEGEDAWYTLVQHRIRKDITFDKRWTYQYHYGLYEYPYGYINLLYSQPCLTVFPEMKTALRTYHPVPSLQKSDGNAQDAPRIKNCLKAALLPSELKGVAPSTPEEVLEKQVTKFQSLLIKYWICWHKHHLDSAIEAGSMSSYKCCQPNICAS